MTTGSESRYVPPRIAIVCPGRTTVTALFSVAYGRCSVPSPLSEPLGATKMSAAPAPSGGRGVGVAFPPGPPDAGGVPVAGSVGATATGGSIPTSSDGEPGE
jgi:hypothetical protein